MQVIVGEIWLDISFIVK